MTGHNTSKPDIHEVILVLLGTLNDSRRFSSWPLAVLVSKWLAIVLDVALDCHLELLYQNLHLLELEDLQQGIQLLFRDGSIVKLGSISANAHDLLQFLEELSE